MKAVVIIQLVVGAAMVVVGVVVLLRRRRFEARARTAQGQVVDLTEDSGEFPIVTFTAETPSGAQAIRFRSHQSEGSYQIGQQLPVLYDPDKPNAASVTTGRLARTLSVALILGGLGTGIMGVLVGALLGPASEAAKASVEAFFEGLRRDDPAALAVVGDPGLAETLKASQTHESTRSSIGTRDACFQLDLTPRGGTVYLRAAKVDDRWQVVEVAKELPCASELE